MTRAQAVWGALSLFACIVLYVWHAVPVARSSVEYLFWRWSSSGVSFSGQVESGDAQIFYDVTGSGPPLVLLHGGLSSPLDWAGEIPSLSQQFTIVTVSLRGHGRSTLGSVPLTYALLADDVRAVLDALEYDCVDIAGWSDGANAGLLFAHQYPDRVNRLVAISANFHPQGIADDILDAVAESPENAGSLFGRTVHWLLSGERDAWPELRGQITQMWQSYPRLSLADLGTIDTPTLIMIGETDYIERTHARQLVGALPHAQLVIVPNVGHAVPRDAPNFVVSAIQRFFEQEPSANVY